MSRRSSSSSSGVGRSLWAVAAALAAMCLAVQAAPATVGSALGSEAASQLAELLGLDALDASEPLDAVVGRLHAAAMAEAGRRLPTEGDLGEPLFYTTEDGVAQLEEEAAADDDDAVPPPPPEVELPLPPRPLASWTHGGLEATTLSVQPGPRLFYVDDFLSADEVKYMLERAERNLDKFGAPGRTGISYEMPIDEDDVLRAVAQREYDLLGLENKMHGTFRVRRYRATGQEYHPVHTDTYTASPGSTLIATAILYLTEPEEGGETTFVNYGRTREEAAADPYPENPPHPIQIKPRAGRLAVWLSCTPDGRDDPMSAHGSEPIVRGTKWTYTIFVYAHPAHCRRVSSARLLGRPAAEVEAAERLPPPSRRAAATAAAAASDPSSGATVPGTRLRRITVEEGKDIMRRLAPDGGVGADSVAAVTTAEMKQLDELLARVSNEVAVEIYDAGDLSRFAEDEAATPAAAGDGAEDDEGHGDAGEGDEEDEEDAELEEMRARGPAPVTLSPEEMPAAPEGAPRVQILSRYPGPRVFMVDDFASPEEVAYILAKAKNNSYLFRDTQETGRAMELPVEGDPVLERLVRREYDLLGMENDQPWSLRVREYVPDKYHPLHTDSYDIQGSTLIATMLLGLTETEDGGATVFPNFRKDRKLLEADRHLAYPDMDLTDASFLKRNPDVLAVRPKPGRLLVWMSCTPGGKDDVMSVHGSEPVRLGLKWNAANFVYNAKSLCPAEHVPWNAADE